jgi:membrane-associated phospholipid phosphatase
MPFLQTPPFPEYASGHSTISAAAAEALTTLFGDNVAFTDSTEYKYDHGVRKFSSFRQAALECSISRVYGGIHYQSGCDEGNLAGVKIGQFVSEKLKTKK